MIKLMNVIKYGLPALMLAGAVAATSNIKNSTDNNEPKIEVVSENSPKQDVVSVDGKEKVLTPVINNSNTNNPILPPLAAFIVIPPIFIPPSEPPRNPDGTPAELWHPEHVTEDRIFQNMQNAINAIDKDLQNIKTAFKHKIRLFKAKRKEKDYFKECDKLKKEAELYVDTYINKFMENKTQIPTVSVSPEVEKACNEIIKKGNKIADADIKYLKSVLGDINIQYDKWNNQKMHKIDEMLDYERNIFGSKYEKLTNEYITNGSDSLVLGDSHADKCWEFRESMEELFFQARHAIYHEFNAKDTADYLRRNIQECIAKVEKSNKTGWDISEWDVPMVTGMY